MNIDKFIWWVKEDHVGAMMTPIVDPLRRYQQSAQLTDFDDDLPKLYSKGIRTIVSLINSPNQESIYESAGFSFLSSPVKDFQAPDFEQTIQICQFIENAPKALLVTCEGGLGKSGTVLALWNIYKGASADDSLNLIRKSEPGAIESQQQIHSLYDFEKKLRK